LHPKLRERILAKQGCIHDLRRACCYTIVETVNFPRICNYRTMTTGWVIKEKNFWMLRGGICINCFQGEFFKNQWCPKQKNWQIDIQ
jgi:hypothetical protein